MKGTALWACPSRDHFKNREDRTQRVPGELVILIASTDSDRARNHRASCAVRAIWVCD